VEALATTIGLTASQVQRSVAPTGARRRSWAPPAPHHSTPEIRKRWPNGVIGRADHLNERTVTRGSYGPNGGSVHSVTTVRFRLNPLTGGTPLRVRLRGSFVDGAIDEDEIVEARGKMRRGELRATHVYSHTTGDTLRVKFRRVQLVLGIIVAIALLAWFLYLWRTSARPL
jgi:hypothetical protein